MVLGIVRDAVWFAIGYGSWPVFEYGIHGLLSHRFRTPVGAMHARHHQDPHAVFTPPVGWVPAFAVVSATSMLLLGPRRGTAFSLGTLTGFVRYERFHYRIHFDGPRNERERTLFEHHMAHHFLDGTKAHGVTSRFFDRLLGTMPSHGVPQRRLDGSSNFREVYSWQGSLDTLATAREQFAPRT